MDFRYSKSEDMTSSGEKGLNIRRSASPKMGQYQVSVGVSVLYWLAAPTAMPYGNLPEFGNEVKVGNKVQFGTVMSQNVV